MFDVAWSEMGLVAAIAVIFLGPEELPKVVRAISKVVRGVKRTADEFRRQFDEVLEVDDLKKIKDDINKEIKLIAGEDGKMYESYGTADLGKIHTSPNPASSPPPLPSYKES